MMMSETGVSTFSPSPSPSRFRGAGAGVGVGVGAGASTSEAGDGGSGGRTLNWGIYTVAELVKFRDEITKALPPLELGHLNLEEEMLLQYHVLRAMQGAVIEDVDVPVNQRAQVANTVAATLKTLGEQQIELYSSERFKAIENLLIRTLDKLPEDLAAAFLVDYEKILLKHTKK